jgi:hypothetical protein
MNYLKNVFVVFVFFHSLFVLIDAGKDDAFGGGACWHRLPRHAVAYAKVAADASLARESMPQYTTLPVPRLFGTGSVDSLANSRLKVPLR